ncbi:MAG: DUF22 domain-containing protein [Candidatus Syntropharchaeia archaeon]
MKYALGFVASLVSIGPPKRVEEDRTVENVLFYPIENTGISPFWDYKCKNIRTRYSGRYDTLYPKTTT